MEDGRDLTNPTGGRKKWTTEEEASAALGDLVIDAGGNEAKVHDLTSHYRRSIATQSPNKGAGAVNNAPQNSGSLPPQFPFSVHAYDVSGGATAKGPSTGLGPAEKRAHRATVAFTPSQVNSAKNRDFSSNPTLTSGGNPQGAASNVNLETTSGSGTKPQQTLHSSQFVSAVMLSLWDFSSGPRPEQVWVAEPSPLKAASSAAPAPTSGTTAMRDDWHASQVVDLASPAVGETAPASGLPTSSSYHIQITDHQYLGPKPTQLQEALARPIHSSDHHITAPNEGQEESDNIGLDGAPLRSTSPSSGAHTTHRDTTTSSGDGVVAATLPLTVAEHDNLRASFSSPPGTISPPLPNTIPFVAPSTKVTKLLSSHGGGSSRSRRNAASDLDLAGSFGFEVEEDEPLSGMIDENYVAKKNPPLKKSLAARLKDVPRVMSSHPKHAKTNTNAANTLPDSTDLPSPKGDHSSSHFTSDFAGSTSPRDPDMQNQSSSSHGHTHKDDDVADLEREDSDEKPSLSVGSLNSRRHRSYSLTGDSSSRTSRFEGALFDEHDGDADPHHEHFDGGHHHYSSSDDSDSSSSDSYSASSSDAWDEEGDDDDSDGQSTSSSSMSEHIPTSEESVFASGDIMAIASHVAKYTLGSDLAELVSTSTLTTPTPANGGGIMMDPWNITSNNHNGYGDGNNPSSGFTGDGPSHPVGSTLSNVFGGSDDGDFGFFGERSNSGANSASASSKRDGNANGNGNDKNGPNGPQNGSGGLDGTDPNGDPNASSSSFNAKMASGEDDSDAVNFLGIEHKLHVFESAPYFTLSAVFTAPYNVKITGPSASSATATSGIASLVESSASSTAGGNGTNAPTFAADPTKFAFSLLLPMEVYDTFTRHYAALIDRLNQWVVLYVYLCQLRPQQALPLIHKEVVRAVMQINRLLGCEGITLPALKNTLFSLARPNSHDSTPGSYSASSANTSTFGTSSSASHPSHHLHTNTYSGHNSLAASMDGRQGGYSPFSPPSSPMPSNPHAALPSHLNYMHSDFMSGDESSLSVGTGPSLGTSFSPSPFSLNPLDGMTSPNSSFGDIPHFYGADGYPQGGGGADRPFRISTSITSANSPNLGMHHAPLSPRGGTPREFDIGHSQLSASSPAVTTTAAPIPILNNERSGSASAYSKDPTISGSNTSWIEEPKKVRDFLALVLTSHFQTHQRTVILGEDLELVNLFVSTLAVFLSPEDRAKSRLATFHNIPTYLGGKSSAPQRNRNLHPSANNNANGEGAPFVATFFPGPNNNASALQGGGLASYQNAPSGVASPAPNSGKLFGASTKDTSAATMTTYSTAGFGISVPVSQRVPSSTSSSFAASTQQPTPGINSTHSSSGNLNNQQQFIASVNVPVTSAPSPSVADFRHLRRDVRRDSTAPPPVNTPSTAAASTIPTSATQGSSPSPHLAAGQQHQSAQQGPGAAQWHFIHQHFYMDGYVPDLILQGIHGNAKLVRNSAYIQGSMPVTLVDLNRRNVTQTHPFHQFRLLRCEFHQAVLYKLLRIKKTNLWNTQETLFQQVKDPSAIVRKLVFESMRLPEQLILPYISIALKNLMARTYTLVKYVEGLEQGSPGIAEENKQNLVSSAYGSLGNASSGDGKTPSSGKGSRDSTAPGEKDKNRLPNSDRNGAPSNAGSVLAPPPVPSPSNAYYASGPALPSHSDPFADIQFSDSHASNPRYGPRSRSGSSSSTSSAAATPHPVASPISSATLADEGVKEDTLPSPHSYASLTSIFASPPPNLFHHHHHHLYQHNHATCGLNAHGMALGEIRTNPSLLKRIRHDLDLDDSCFNVLLGLAELLKPGIFRALFGDPMSQEKKWIELFEGL